MQILNFTVKQQALLVDCPGRPVVAESRKHVYAAFQMDDEWDGLAVTAFFSNDYVPTGARSVVVHGSDPVEIPPEILVTGKLRVSLVGVRNEGRYRLTTLYMEKPIIVFRSGAVSGNTSNETPDLWEQVLALIGDLDDLNTSEKQTLVAAINEAAKTGSGNGGSVALDPTLTQEGKAAEAKAVGAALYKLSSQKVDKDQGAANAGRLLYVGPDGLVVPLTLGNGLQIVNGVLSVTGVVEETAIAFIDNGDGSATVRGVTFEDQGSGVVLMRGYNHSEVTT